MTQELNTIAITEGLIKMLEDSNYRMVLQELAVDLHHLQIVSLDERPICLVLLRFGDENPLPNITIYSGNGSGKSYPGEGVFELHHFELGDPECFPKVVRRVKAMACLT